MYNMQVLLMLLAPPLSDKFVDGLVCIALV